MHKVLITGGAGFIGSHLATILSQTYHVIVIDDLSTGQLTNIKTSKNITFIKGNVCSYHLLEFIFKSHQFDYIYHLAAIASIPDSINRPLETHQINFDATLYILELAKKFQKNLKRLVFTSSASVYGQADTIPKKETSPIHPQTPYAVDKFASEQYVLNANQLYNIPTSVARLFNVYGLNRNRELPYSGVISILLDNYQALLAQERTEFSLFGDGEQARDFIHVDDVVNGLIFIAKSKNAKGKVFNFGTGKMTSLNSLISHLNQIFDQKLPTQQFPHRQGDISKSKADISKLETLGFHPKVQLQTGLIMIAQTLTAHNYRQNKKAE